MEQERARQVFFVWFLSYPVITRKINKPQQLSLQNRADKSIFYVIYDYMSKSCQNLLLISIPFTWSGDYFYLHVWETWALVIL